MTAICVFIRPGNKENLNRFILFKIIHMHASMKIIKPQKGSVGSQTIMTSMICAYTLAKSLIELF